MAYLGEGAMIGEIAMAMKTRRTATVRTVTFTVGSVGIAYWCTCAHKLTTCVTCAHTHTQNKPLPPVLCAHKVYRCTHTHTHNTHNTHGTSPTPMLCEPIPC